ncbi:hypothetical protein JW899_03405 [Candidatus Uhrbacteria bacterium]|nr:hypothetical protein [Candidatus Uhrbacteria bacterium]
MVKRAAERGQTVTYGQLCRRLGLPGYHPRSPRLHRDLEEICRAAVRSGRPMPCAVVVRGDTGRPGAGFFRLARKLGRRGSDAEIFRRELLAIFPKKGRNR